MTVYGEEPKEIITDTFLEDYEEFLDDDDDRWCPPALQALGRDRNAAIRRGKLRS